MVDKIVELENGKSYVILDKKILDNRVFYYGLRLSDKEEPTDDYLFFEETNLNDEAYLAPVVDDSLKGILLTVFTVNYLDRASDL